VRTTTVTFLHFAPPFFAQLFFNQIFIIFLPSYFLTFFLKNFVLFNLCLTFLHFFQIFPAPPELKFFFIPSANGAGSLSFFSVSQQSFFSGAKHASKLSFKKSIF
jgi:hypothetical protein